MRDIEIAALWLQEFLKGHSWFGGVGIGKVYEREGIVVYVTRRYYRQSEAVIPSQCNGFPVRETASVPVAPMLVRSHARN